MDSILHDLAVAEEGPSAPLVAEAGGSNFARAPPREEPEAEVDEQTLRYRGLAIAFSKDLFDVVIRP